MGARSAARILSFPLKAKHDLFRRAVFVNMCHFLFQKTGATVGSMGACSSSTTNFKT